jgi:hypothetical protein
MATIKDMLDSIPGVRADWVEDWREDARADFAYDWDSTPGGAPAAAPVNTALPVVTGTAQVGQTLSLSNGTWTGNPAPTFTYAWLVDGTPVVGETANTYVVQAGDVGFDVEGRVTATNIEGAVSATSVAVGPVIA